MNIETLSEQKAMNTAFSCTIARSIDIVKVKSVSDKTKTLSPINWDISILYRWPYKKENIVSP